MICKYCGTLVSDEMKFCTNCGKKMERKTSYCTNCGNIINFNSKFCNICGAPTIIAEKMKKIRVSKVYSLIMLAITALVVAFVPSVTLSGRTARRKRIHRRRGFPRLLRNDHHGYPDPFRRRGLRHRPEFERGAETDHLKQTT